MRIIGNRGNTARKVQAVASGALASGDTVIVNANGTVSVVSGSAVSVGSASVFESASTDYPAVTFDSNSNKIVIAYRDLGNSNYGTAIVGTVSGTSITFGTPVVYVSASSTYNSATFDSNSNNFNVDLNNYQGPLDILLDLAKAQKVNLENISITKLADQFHEYITNKKNLNLETASEYLLMATWLTYLKSKLLLPGNPEEEFKLLEVAEKLKLQLKKLELIRLLSDQMLKRKRLGKEIRFRGIKGNIKSIYSTEYKLNLYDLIKAYSGIIMTKDFLRMNIPKLPVFTTEDGIKRIREFFGKLLDWKNINDLIPQNFKKGSKNIKTGKVGIFAGSLELVKEGNLTIKQENLFDDIYIKEIK